MEADESSQRSFYNENQIVVLAINFRTTADDLYKAFSRFGKINDLHLTLNENYESKGYAFISYDERPSAQNAIIGMNGRRFDGKMIKVDWANKTEADKSKKNSTKKINSIDVSIKNMLEKDLLNMSRQLRKKDS